MKNTDPGIPLLLDRCTVTNNGRQGADGDTAGSWMQSITVAGGRS